MAFDQTQIRKDLQQLNIAPDETRIAQPTAIVRNVESFFPNPPALDVGSPGSGTQVFYQATGSDGGIVGLGYSNAVAGVSPQWCSQVPVAIGHGAPTVGFNYAQNLGNRVAGNATDQASGDMAAGFVYSTNVINRPSASLTEVSSDNSASGFGSSPNTRSHVAGIGLDHQLSEESGDDSLSGKKVKFLCSFGGRILPRPSDGMLRYVGGQTRIISVRRDVGFNELVQRMADAYGQPVVIKYQLPDEDFDALVSVSCADDLVNMMDEYEKLAERSVDGSAKLRVFLFSASEQDSPGATEFTDMRESGQRYIEAVNSVADGVCGSIMRKESGLSGSTQNSDFSVTEGVDGIGVGQGDVSSSQSRSISPREYLVSHHVTSPQHSGLDPNTTIPLVNNVMQQPGVGFSPSTNYTHTYIDPRQEVMSNTVLPSQMGFPNSQLLGAGGPMYTQQQFHDNFSVVSSPQFIPTMHMTMTPSSSHAGMRPTVMQPLQTRSDSYPEESTFGGKVLQLPSDQNYHSYQAQVPSAMGGGGYVLGPQMRPLDHVFLSDGLVSQQQVMTPEKVQRLNDCFMCQKALPHVHSNASSQDDRDSIVSPISDSSLVYHSPRLEENVRPWPLNMGMAARTAGEGVAEQGTSTQSRVLGHMDHQVGAAQPETVGFSRNTEAQYKTERIIFQKNDNLDHPGTSVPQGVMGLTGAVQSPYGVFKGGISQPSQDNTFQQSLMPIQYQVKQEGLASKPTNTDASPIVVFPSQASKADVGQDSTKEDIMNKPQQAEGYEGLVDTTFSQPQLILVPDHNKPTEVLLHSHPKVPHVHNIMPVESSEAVEQSNIGSSVPYYPPQAEICHLDPIETAGGKVVVSGVESTYVIDKILPVPEWRDESSLFHPKIVIEDMKSSPSDSYMPSSSSPSTRTCDPQDFSHSLFSNQDPWNRQQDRHLFPPRLEKIETEKESFYTPFGDTSLVNSGELLEKMMSDDRVLQPLCNQDKDCNSDVFVPIKGPAEELVKQELQAPSEGVAASVFQTTTPTDPDLAMQNEEECSSETDIEDGKTKTPEKVNSGFPVSDGLGRLQIIKNSDLEQLQELGSGTFGTVYHGKWRGTDVAIKRINDRCFSGKASEQECMRNNFWNEAIKLADLHHPNVVAFYGVVLDGPEGSVATVTEYMVNGSLKTALERNERNLDKRKRLLIAMDVAFGMEYLHGKNVVHFDLKSDNLLVNLRDSHRPICKVGDLGLSKVKCHTLISGGVRGTLPWMAPELLNGSSSLVSDKVDVFSFGIVLWELLTGDEPYADLHYGAIIGGIVSNTLRPALPEWCDSEWRSVIERCWAAEPQERPNFTEIANELRSMAAKLPSKGQATPQQQGSSPQSHFQK